MDEIKYQNRFREKLVYEIDYSDLDDILKEEYNLNGDFSCAIGQSNDSTLEIEVDEDFDDDLQEILNPSNYDGWITTSALLHHLCSLNKIEPGTYLIQICW